MRCSALEASAFCGRGQGCVLEAFQNCSVPGCHRDDPLYEAPMHVCSEDKAKGQCKDGPLREAAFSHACRPCPVLLPCPWGRPCQPPWPPGPPLSDTPHRRVWFRVVRTCQKRDRGLECWPGALSGVGVAESASAPQLVPTQQLPLTKRCLPKRRENRPWAGERFGQLIPRQALA